MDFRRLLGTTAFSTMCVLGALSRSAPCAPSLRYQTDLHGDVVLFGNTTGFDCRTGIPDPVVGTVDRSHCYRVEALNDPLFLNDSSGDVFFRAEDSGQVTSGYMLTRDQARSAAVLQLPSDATVAYARLYWSSTVREDMSPDSRVTLDRPGSSGFSQALYAGVNELQVADRSYQGTADVTALLQKYGAGVYRLSGAAKNELTDRYDDNNYVAWGIVVVYNRDADRIRSFSLWDGLTFVSPNNSSGIMVRGFVVPPDGPGESKLAVIGYEGDHDLTDDTLSVNGTRLGDGESGSETNFFNSTRTRLGQPQSVAGDLPQMSGGQGSMNGVDLDVVDITSRLSANDAMAQIDFATGTKTTSDSFFVGALVTAIVSKKPILDTVLTVPQGTSPLPGDSVEYTVTVRNSGDDTATNAYVEQKLPPGLSYVAESVRVGVGTGFVGKTDKAGDDEVDYDANTGTLRIRVGNGASATQGGNLASSDAAVTIKYVLRVADTASGPLPNQVYAYGTPNGRVDAGTSLYPSTNAAGALPNLPTVIVVRECGSNFDCTSSAPVCVTSSMPHRCTDACTTDTECANAPGGKDVCGELMKCAQCSQTKKAACVANGPGSACLGSGACGCMSDSDCGGRHCDVATNTCPNPTADLSVVVTAEPDPADAMSPLVAKIAVKNAGPAAAPSGVKISFQVPAGGSVGPVDASGGWRCTPSTDIIRCVYNRPIAVGASTPEVKVTVTPTMAQAGAAPSSVTLKATVTSDVSSDPNGADNDVSKNVQLGHYRVVGGGFGCQAAHGNGAAGTAGVVAFLLLSLLARRRRISSETEDSLASRD